MSKFIQHPFDFQIRSAIRREASAINSIPTIDITPSILTQINYLIYATPNLIATLDISEEFGTNPIEVIEHDLDGSIPSLTAVVSMGTADPIYESVVFIAEPDVLEENTGTSPIESVLVEISTSGTFPSLEAEASIVVV